MKPFYVLVLTAFLPLAALAQQPPAPLMGAEVVLADLKWVKRLVVVFADSPQDPNFTRQMTLLARDPAGLAERDLVIVIDTDPANPSPIRKQLRPRGFSLVLIDKDGEAKLRKPLPWDVREITRAVDKFPDARQEALERYPAGR